MMRRWRIFHCPWLGREYNISEPATARAEARPGDREANVGVNPSCKK